MNKSRSAFLVFILLVLPLNSFAKNETEAPPQDEFVVVLDAGHGGHDPGNIGNGYLEKDISLAIVLKIGEELKKHPGIKVVYTRDDDTFIDLFVRGKIANEAGADLFVSVHCNAHSSDAYGAETYVLGLHANRQNFEVAKKENSVIYLEDDYEQRYAEYDINSPESVIGLTIMQEEFLDQSIQLGKKLQDNFTKKLSRKDRKVKQAGFIVLHQTFMPSVLVEAGFLTNKSEGGYLNSKKGQDEMGTAIADAILAYKAEMGIGGDASVGTPAVKEAKTPKTVPEVVEQKEETSTKKVQKEKETITATKPVKEEEAPVSKSGVVFKVQLMASAKNIPLKGENFNGLDQLSKEPYKNLFRYLYGNANTLEEAKRLKAKADAKGYTTSYIVAYKDGNRVPLSQAQD
ncbi:N-acetylmuramoyl-L-alanine amidase [Flagellimonas taeanensis]|uniref:N-acetylmuramoyl-L-alanine amidase family protein n=1 Tax=Flavobacteriaceae TaxID=49546 RepID=UPI000E687498|nr:MULTISPECIES: N-acetylmuramoyl-L-alanine amidase [Allomuricauda]MDC6385759.1 N-acetylmuramoyl-L-alanine amidase [Muricauda sp. SK9]RIV50954.1 N-acetylmuramoyl-L-alanine amidase [Allomuricauda taeanensis]